MFLEGTLVRTALRGMLTVDKGVILLAVLRGMGKGNVDALPREVDNGVKSRSRHVVVEQVLQAVAAENAAVVVEDGQSRIQIGVITQHILHVFTVETIVLKESLVRFKEDVRTVFFLRLSRFVADQYTAFEDSLAHLSVAHASGNKSAG